MRMRVLNRIMDLKTIKKKNVHKSTDIKNIHECLKEKRQ